MAEANFVDAVIVEKDTNFTEDQIEYLTSGLTGEDRQVARLFLQYRPTRKLRAGLPRSLRASCGPILRKLCRSSTTPCRRT